MDERLGRRWVTTPRIGEKQVGKPRCRQNQLLNSLVFCALNALTVTSLQAN